MAITSDERDLLLAALFELRITHAEDDTKAAQIKALSWNSAATRTPRWSTRTATLEDVR